jgi:hypothetical protein
MFTPAMCIQLKESKENAVIRAGKMQPIKVTYNS